MGACGRALGSELLCLISSGSSKHYVDEERKGGEGERREENERIQRASSVERG
jgi:hypothetical protein